MRKTPELESLLLERKSLAETFPEENRGMTTFETFVEAKAAVPLSRLRNTLCLKLGGTTKLRPSIAKAILGFLFFHTATVTLRAPELM